ncbi:hypothetical protein FDP41_009618 [Naegleria fowleri]|uniref:Actin-related protein 2/3 complex subunit 3 n=1 Tax=Naegleria fowleri TaxID=5763 RepID=A0A6A5B9W8_NAEFO|nr:uncharacterized protein FDP41_009618 [Naegleria fowleri]KAF0971922.1 hypothetical protein FDP41_009618 [Naegleria fowleri]CAG4707848.1 unnamed protein product [Naegleria fowleri]
MPAYHSSFKDAKCEVVCGTAFLPLKTKVKGPAPKELDDKKEDIIDEVLKYFKANMLFRTFQVESPADRTLIYLTLYTHYLLKNVENKKTAKKMDADKLFFQLCETELPGPGDSSFELSAFYEKPRDSEDKKKWQAYMRQAKEELGLRLAALLFTNDSGPDKYWMQFSKRRFLGKTFIN